MHRVFNRSSTHLTGLIATLLLATLLGLSWGCRTTDSQRLTTSYCSKSPEVADGAIVIRGGLVNSKALAEGGEIDGAGYMTDLSVNCSGLADAPNNVANRRHYKRGIPNTQYGVTSAKKICQKGGYIRPTPYPGHPYHCTVWHLKPKDAASLFTQY